MPRRGYRFTADVRLIEPDEIVLERRTQTRTLIEFPDAAASNARGRPFRRATVYAAIVVTLAASAFFGSRYFGSQTPDPGIKSIAVLPFVNVSGDQNTEYLSDGIPDALINSLTELQQLRVVRATAVRYRTKEVDP